MYKLNPQCWINWLIRVFGSFFPAVICMAYIDGFVPGWPLVIGSEDQLFTLDNSSFHSLFSTLHLCWWYRRSTDHWACPNCNWYIVNVIPPEERIKRWEAGVPSTLLSKLVLVVLSDGVMMFLPDWDPGLDSLTVCGSSLMSRWQVP